ncbi:ABC transporter substrate-binding protein [Fibrella aquatilis]|uniref:ABC transporter substrate-binding protein n=1 Tax=Fibrella aquatilis TaxID=2817059 RepID=A0A939K3B0_9BACT|nr:helical backbone metal receptor [Fibrella aquatilis]MBO0934165.1 ABC transporter substrate-binding protein [Fibrella aquatilis]
MNPLRIVSIVPSQTELLFHLGVGPAVVGRTKFCIYPADEVASVPVVGGTKNVDSQRVAALKPTLILANREENTRVNVEALQAIAPVHVTDVTTLPDALAMIRDVGRLVGKSTEAETLAQQITVSMAALPAPPERPRVAYLIWRKPWMVAAADTFIDAMLTAAGFTNAFANQMRYPVITETDWQAAQPDLIFLSSEPYPFKAKHIAELQQLCPQAKIRLVDGELFSWYGSRLLRSATYFSALRQETIPPLF